MNKDLTILKDQSKIIPTGLKNLIDNMSFKSSKASKISTLPSLEKPPEFHTEKLIRSPKPTFRMLKKYTRNNHGVSTFQSKEEEAILSVLINSLDTNDI